jgi:hypothetical protein
LELESLIVFGYLREAFFLGYEWHGIVRS